MNDVSFRVKAYIENGWADRVINPEGFSSSREPEQHDSSISPPTEGWKSIESAYRSLDDVPKISLSNVINYFVMRTASDGKAANDFKSINQSAENLFRCGHVQGLLIVYKDEYWWIKADCRPEMKKDKMYKMMMSLCKGSWDINSAMCGCPAGKGPSASCKHIGALCYALANFCSFGQLPEFATCTDILQHWNRPCPKKQDSIAVDQLKLRRQDILNQKSKSQPVPTMYDPRPLSVRVVDHKRLEQLRLNLLSIDHQCAILQQLIPSCEYLKHDHAYCQPMSDETQASEARSEVSLIANSDKLDHRWVTLAEEKHQVYLELIVSPARRLEIELLTRQQTETPLWHEVCARRITASKSGKILCQVTRTDALLWSILYPPPMLHKPPPIQWGIQNEKLARNVYTQHMREAGHTNLVVKDCGFIVSLSKGWLGASPDGQVYDPTSDNPNGLLEIKCPYTKRAQSPQEACEDPSFYCTMEGNKLKLKFEHPYYHQVQQQLYASQDLFSWCDFCVFTTKGCLVTRITLDDRWVDENIPKLQNYFEEVMLEEIVKPHLKPPYYL